MKKTKEMFYAVKRGRVPGIYRTWKECEEQIYGYSGAKHRLFFLLEDAQAYLDADEPEKALPRIPQKLQGRHLDIYIAGSFKNGLYGWAYAVYHRQKRIHLARARGQLYYGRSAHGTTGELEATIRAIEWAEEWGASLVTIHHRYEGVSEFASGAWEATARLTRDYVTFIKPRLGWIRFTKAAANLKGKLANKLAGEAIQS